MKSWGCDFGYELVGDDWKLAYPQPNPRLADVVRDAIASARVNQARLIAAAPRQYHSQTRPTYRASSSGGFVPEDGGSEEDDGGYRTAAPAGPVGRNGGGYGGQGNGGNGGQGNGGVYGSNGHGGNGTGTGNDYNPYVAIPERQGTAGVGGAGLGGSVGGVSTALGLH